MLAWIAFVLFAASAIGLAILLAQLVALVRQRRETPRRPTRAPRLSILKPLCGMDDDLEESLVRFAELDYPDYELLLGLETPFDAAGPTARAAVAKWPGRVRLVVQRSAAGLNPKVNQLAGLAAAATGEIVVVSDSNARSSPDFLFEIAALFEDPQVGLVAHPVVGQGEESIGAAMDNLHMGSIGLGLVAAKRLVGQDVVVGKTMSLRRRDLEALGGFAAVSDVLAEDFVLGRWVSERLGLRVALAHTVVESIARRRSIPEFLNRFRRWSVMQRMAVGNGVYVSQLLLNPLALALAGYAVHPTREAAFATVGCGVLRTAVDGYTGRLLRPGGFGWRTLACSPWKDVLMGVAWWHGLTHDSVMWRGHQLFVRPGTRLVRADEGEGALPDGALAPRHGR